jgi:hypothetical protein
MHKLHAAAVTEPAAEAVSFQRQQPSLPPHKNVNSAARSPDLARHFGGKYAINAAIANLLQQNCN